MGAEKPGLATALCAFLERYTERGFGTLTKKEVDRLVFQLLVETGDLKGELDSFAVARQLKISPTKAAGLIYEYELFQPTVRDEAWLKAQFGELLKHTRMGKSDKDKIKLEVRDRLLREEIENFIRSRKLGPVPDYRLNRNLLEIEFDAFCELMLQLSDETSLKKIKEELLRKNLITNDYPQAKELISILIRSAIDRAFNESIDSIDLSGLLVGGKAIVATLTSLLS
jgi:hypothetical protein